MNVAEVLAALELPRSAHVDQRVAKKLLVDNGAATPADKRCINEAVEELTWVAALKPNNIAVPEYRDDVRDYLEIAVLSLRLRSEARPTRLVQLIHRAIPYPVLLVATQSGNPTLSVAHKRRAQNEGGKVVLDPGVVEVEAQDGLSFVSLTAQPRAHMLALYEGWHVCVEALQASRITGQCKLPSTPEDAIARRVALAEYTRLTREISQLRSQAERERQIPRRVDLNLEIKKLEASLAEARLRL